MTDVTRILDAIRDGDERATDRLLTAVYDELRRLAAAKLRREPPGQTLQATALVHEAYLRLVGGAGASFENRAHFFASAAEAMRRILVDRARRKARLKHGGGRKRVELSEADRVVPPVEIDLVALDEALAKLEAEEPAKAELVKLRYFAGLSHEEAAEILGISRGTADRHWAYARAWLFHEIEKGG
ncbi:MAG: sigma-70 family RNA polymerase sigma factor [Planctomycetota bacterium]|jgi:RNA polymerase sigma factor (TIGR02999 family)